MDFIGKIKLLFFVSPALVTLGMILHIVGTATPNWRILYQEQGHFGLWQLCDQFQRCYVIADEIKPPELKICEAFAVLGIFFQVGVLLMCAIHMLKSQVPYSTQRLHICTAIVLSVAAVACILVCVLVFAIKFNGDNSLPWPTYEMGYSLYLSSASGTIMLVSSGLFDIYRRYMGNSSYQLVSLITCQASALLGIVLEVGVLMMCSLCAQVCNQCVHMKIAFVLLLFSVYSIRDHCITAPKLGRGNLGGQFLMYAHDADAQKWTPPGF